MTVAVRLLLRAASVLRFVPGGIYLTLGALLLPLIELAGPAWKPFTSLGGIALIIWGACRAFRRQRALSGWKPWKP